MKLTVRQLMVIGVYTVSVLSFTGCASPPSVSEMNIRPACVTLENCSYVIEQVMNVQPAWELLQQSTDGYQYQWHIDNENGEHTLTARLTPDGCVCAAASSSQFLMGIGEEKIAGLLQGAVVAPVSNLDYAAKWLEPKVSFSCGVAHISKATQETHRLWRKMGSSIWP